MEPIRLELPKPPILPEFPTAFTPEDTKRKEELAEQRKKMAEVYQQHFAKDVWGEKPAIERGLRRIVPGWLPDILQVHRMVEPLVPDDWTFGMTPEQVQEEMFRVETEYVELVRKEKITRLLPNIQADLMVAALAGKSITNLTGAFPELRSDFTTEERAYINIFAEIVRNASIEDILSGKIFGATPGHVPITEIGEEELGKDPLAIDPRFVLSRVAFSKDIGDISAALQEVFPPQVDEKEISEIVREKLFRQLRQRAIDQGIHPPVNLEDEEDIRRIIQEIHEKVSEQEGVLITLTGKQEDIRGILREETLVARKKADGTVWMGGDLLGFYDEEQRKVVPIDLRTGEPLRTEEEQEWILKDYWDNLHRSSVEAIHRTKRFVTVDLPSHILKYVFSEWPDPVGHANEMVERGTITEEERDDILDNINKRREWLGVSPLVESSVIRQVDGIKATLDERWFAQQERHEQWLKDNPQLAPRPEWNVNPIEQPSVLLDPGYLGHLITSAAPLIVGALVLGVGTTLATKNPLAGATAGAAVMTPFMADSVTEGLVTHGMPLGEARELGTMAGIIMGAIEIVPGALVLKATQPLFMRVFKKHLATEMSRGLSRGAKVKVAAGTGVKIWGAEVMEENLQLWVENATLMTVDELRGVFDNTARVTIESAITIFPLAMFGGGGAYLGMKSQLSTETQEEIDVMTERMVEAGLSPSHAELVAVTSLVETETGQAEIAVAANKAEAVIPPLAEIIEKLKPLQSRLEHTVEDKNTFTTSIMLQEEKLKKLTLPWEIQDQIQRIEGLKEVFGELEIERVRLSEQIEKMKDIIAPPEELAAPLRIAEAVEPIDPVVEPVVTPVVELPLAEAGKPYTGVIYRGEGQDTPVDEGIYGKGTYYTTSEKYASQYGEVQEVTVSLKNPFVISSSSEIEVFGDEAFIQAREEGKSITEAEEERSKAIRETLEAQGYDGIVLRETPKSHQIVVFYPEETVVPKEIVPEFPEPVEPVDPAIKPEIEPGFEIPIDSQMDLMGRFPRRKRPMAETWEVEQADVEAVKRANPELDKLFPAKKEAGEIRVRAEKGLRGLHQELEVTELDYRKSKTESMKARTEATKAKRKLRRAELKVEKAEVTVEVEKAVIKVKEARVEAVEADIRATEAEARTKEVKQGTEVEKEKVIDKFRTLAKETLIKKEKLMTTPWKDFTFIEQGKISLAAIPDGSLKLPWYAEGVDIEYLGQLMQEITHLPIYDVVARLELGASAAETAKELILKRFAEDPNFALIKKDPESWARVSQQINSQNKVSGVVAPEFLSPEEHLLVDAFQEVYDDYKPLARYLRVMRVESTMKAFKAKFPDAVAAGKEVELAMALELKNKGNLNDLWAYLYDLDWGVVKHGYDPRYMLASFLEAPDPRLESIRGEDRLKQRESIQYDETKMAQKNPFRRLGSYTEQMEILRVVAPEIEKFNEYWKLVYRKFGDHKQIESGLQKWLDRIQGRPLEYSKFDRAVLALRRQAMIAIFLEPALAFRNSLQAILFHPDRTELVRLFIQPLPDELKESGKIFYDTFVSQLGGLKKEWLQIGQPGLPIPGLSAINRLADHITLYAKSDYWPRLHSFFASLNKAQRATKGYLKDGNIKRWLRKSGGMHLRQTEREYVITHFLLQSDKMFDLEIEGLGEVSGADMANFYVARRVADKTHFKYRRHSRGLMEMGVTGETMWNLIVFPRGYAQRVGFQSEKIHKAFSGEATWGEAASSFRDIISLVVASLLVDDVYEKITGRKRNPYFILNILFGWTFGGLTLGIALDVSELIGHFGVMGNPLEDEETRNRAEGKATSMVLRLGDALLPFYRRAVDIMDIAFEGTGLDRHQIKRLRAFLEGYTIEDFERTDRSLWETITKAVLGAETPEDTRMQKLQMDLEESRNELGLRQIDGRFYKLDRHGRRVISLTKDIPDALLTEGAGFNALDLFALDSAAQWRELYQLPSGAERIEWRKAHVLEEAMLLFWGKVKQPVFTKGSPEMLEVIRILNMWYSLYGITENMSTEFSR